MNNVETVLVIVLSIGLVVLLILSIILVSIMIAIMQNVRKISNRAEQVTSNLGELISEAGRKFVPVAVSAAVAAAVRRFRRSKDDQKGDE